MKQLPIAKNICTARPSPRHAVSISAFLLLALASVPAHTVHAQNVPFISGSVGMTSVTNEGVTSFSDIVNPVFALPLGSRVLIEGRYNFDEFFVQNNRTGPYNGSFLKANQITQLDYIVNSRMTFVFGQSLIPFNTYNERLSQLWQQNFTAAPMVAAVGTRDSGTAVGAQLRGNAYSNSHVQIGYIGWFSKRQDRFSLNGSRAFGDRIDVVFPNQRIEVGTSFARYEEFTYYNSFGAHFYWLPWRSPLQVRAEYAHDPSSQGYWMEVSYRLSQVGIGNRFFRNVEPLFRMQQSFRNRPFANDGLPNVDTKIADFGLDYHFPHDVRLNSSYSRKFAQGKDGNLWALSLNYRFLFPAWPGRKQ